MDPFTFLNSVNSSKEDIMMSDEDEASYKPFLTNRALSYHLDSIFYANEMNINSHLDSRLQYQYYLNSLPKRKRFSKWAKEETSEDLSLVMDFFGYSRRHAIEALKLLSADDLSVMKQKLNRGGVGDESNRNTRGARRGRAKESG